MLPQRGQSITFLMQRQYTNTKLTIPKFKISHSSEVFLDKDTKIKKRTVGNKPKVRNSVIFFI
ncbi:hypothetical protein EZS27_017656 [termite gut metagenome]|uniref:Uncharacterized protein n=1 Tax=termite gut metagenome TaxID=433724 RepID=A0A5J4RLI6_9ZZZZ